MRQNVQAMKVLPIAQLFRLTGVATLVVAAFGVIAQVCPDEIRGMIGLAPKKPEVLVVNNPTPIAGPGPNHEVNDSSVGTKIIEHHYYHEANSNSEDHFDPPTWFCDTCANRTFSVAQLPNGDPLNVRGGPGTQFEVLWTIPPASDAIICTGNHAQNGDDIWFEVHSRPIEDMQKLRV